MRTAATRALGLRELQAEVIPKVLAGELLLGPRSASRTHSRATSTTYDGNGVTGTKVGVPVLEGKTLLLVSAGRRRRARRSEGPG